VWTPSFWKALAERVLTAFAVSLISVLFVGAEVLDVRQIHWGQALGIAAGAALLSLLKGVVAGQWLGPNGSPSLVLDPAAAGLPPVNVDRPGGTGNWSTGIGTNVRKVGGYRGGDVTPPD
jgi:hypothetical protein